eukprot:3937836-Rhodomonas_salina.3
MAWDTHAGEAGWLLTEEAVDDQGAATDPAQPTELQEANVQHSQHLAPHRPRQEGQGSSPLSCRHSRLSSSIARQLRLPPSLLSPQGPAPGLLANSLADACREASEALWISVLVILGVAGLAVFATLQIVYAQNQRTQARESAADALVC